jgi:hypothetical protein
MALPLTPIAAEKAYCAVQGRSDRVNASALVFFLGLSRRQGAAMNFVSLSSRRRAVAGVEHVLNDQRRGSRASTTARCAAALLLTVAVGCGDSADPEYAGGYDASAPILSPTGGLAYDGGYASTPGAVMPGEVYTLDSGFGVGSFGGTNGNVGGVGSGGAAGAGGAALGGLAGLTGGLGGLTGGGATGALGGALGGLAGLTGGGGSAALGGLGGLLGGLGGGGAALGGLGGGLTGGGTGAPSTPLDPSVKKPDDSKLPKVTGTCPNIASGFVTVNGTTAQLTVGPKAGPVVFYWHGTGTDASESDVGVPGAAADIRANGGMLASFNDSNGKGDNTGDLVWYTGDIESADQLLACAIQKGIVDTGRIHTTGYSAGGLQSGTMLFSRSNYLASVIIYSGGPALGGLVPGSTTFADPSNVPATLGAHGAQGSDWLALDFHDGTLAAEDAVKKAGGFAIDCDDGGDHAIAWLTSRAGVGGQAWKFFKDHPYNSKPDPYMSGLPAGFPSYCKIH